MMVKGWFGALRNQACNCLDLFMRLHACCNCKWGHPYPVRVIPDDWRRRKFPSWGVVLIFHFSSFQGLEPGVVTAIALGGLEVNRHTIV